MESRREPIPRRRSHRVDVSKALKKMLANDISKARTCSSFETPKLPPKLKLPVPGQPPLSYQTSLIKHKFKHKTKDFKSGKPEH